MCPDPRLRGQDPRVPRCRRSRDRCTTQAGRAHLGRRGDGTGAAAPGHRAVVRPAPDGRPQGRGAVGRADPAVRRAAHHPRGQAVLGPDPGLREGSQVLPGGRCR